MMFVLAVIWASICCAETIESILKEDGDKWYLLFATSFNLFFFVFADDLVVSFFVLTFFNLVATFPFYLLGKVSATYPVLKILTYVGFITWLVAFN